MTAITENAAASVRDEAGCLRFDVMEDARRPHYFYEIYRKIYRDAEAFGEYTAAPHFAVWRRAVGSVWCPAARSTPSPTWWSAMTAGITATAYPPAHP